jgi:hypothetical protein
VHAKLNSEAEYDKLNADLDKKVQDIISDMKLK